MQQIDVSVRPLREPRHNSPEEAIEYAKAAEAKYEAGNTAPMLRTPIEQVSYSDESLEIGTARGGMRVHVAGASVAYSLLESYAAMHAPSAQIIDDIVELKFGGPVPTQLVWDRPHIARQMLGATLLKVHGSPDFLWLYFSGIGIVAASVLTNQKTGRSLLYWNFSD